ncbi:MAG: M3 family metallopeptidase [Dysgonamonadaceae bacterium]|jgi:peptidyl-dipeptidase Dcp|nr:M3 family metallopeptidase [Dysgonamonadaceae bacterium]
MKRIHSSIVFILFLVPMMQAKNPLLSNYNTLHGTIPFNEIRVNQYEPAFEEAMRLHDREIRKIIANKDHPAFSNTIEALEYAGERLDKVRSVFSNLSGAESSDEMMAIAQRLQPKLTKHSNNITLNEALFQRVKTVYHAYQKDNALNSLTKEQQRLLQKTYEDFMDRGAGLSAEDKEKYRTLSSQLSMYTLQFGQNALKATNAYILLLKEEKELAGLPQDAVDAAARKAKEKGKEGWIFDLSEPSYGAFMKYSSNRDLRKELYLAYHTRCIGGEFDNLENMIGIINTRLAIANLMGYSSYADYVLRKRMAAHSQNVYALLDELLTGFGPAAREDYSQIQGFAIGKEGKNIEVMPYDWSYYSEQLQKAQLDINDEMIRPYFELEHVKKGVFGLATTLYGLTFKKNPNIQVYHKEVEAFEVYDRDGKYLAVLYTDFFPRKGKRAGAWMTEFQAQEVRNGKPVRPHISLVMNFTQPTDTQPALLTFYEVSTFLHEFGHALHGMLANTTYPSLSGTSVYRDFVELPSQLMENFLLEKEYLDSFAVHYQTGEKIPQEWVQKLIHAANFNAGYACLRQLSFGLLDMAYHTITEPFTGEITPFEHKAIRSTVVVPLVEGALISPTFNHIFSGGYAAGYYSYKWAEVLDADAFALLKEKGIFNPEIAQAFRELLSKGGTENPMDLYVKFRGKKPTTEALMQRSGIVK